jgi:hypothetical protein
MRVIIRGVVNGSSQSLSELGLEGRKIEKVYTIIDEEKLYKQFDPMSGKEKTVDLEGAKLIHWRNVFVEDKMHDWDVHNGFFKFYAHSGNKGDKHDLLLEVDDV